jgi:hypothetical protein
MATIIISFVIGLTAGLFGGILGTADGKYNYHTVFQEFSEMNLTCASECQIRDLCAIINDFVSRGDDHEDAVSTCFLEHTSQIGVRKLIMPYLSESAKTELR